MTNADKVSAKPRLYTCRMKCAICMKTLGVATHVEKSSGVRIDYNECVMHRPLSRYGSVLEWDPEGET